MARVAQSEDPCGLLEADGLISACPASDSGRVRLGGSSLWELTQRVSGVWNFPESRAFDQKCKPKYSRTARTPGGTKQSG